MDQELIPPDPFPQSLPEALTENFYRWEQRGRGWKVWEYPVELEPPFQPFMFHYAPPKQIFDDARKPTFMSSLFESVENYFSDSKSPAPTSPELIPESKWEEVEPYSNSSDQNLIELLVSFPPDKKVNEETSEKFLLSLSNVSGPLVFEILGTEDSVVIQLTCLESDKAHLKQQLQAYFPEGVLSEETEYLQRCWGEMGEGKAVIVDFGLSNEFMLPLKTYRNFDVDPLIGFTAALSDLQKGEIGLFQILFQTVRHPWAENMVRSVTDWEGRAFFGDAPEMVPLAKQKASRPLFASVIRVAAKASDSNRSLKIAQSIGSALNQFSNPMINELIPLNNDDYPDDEHERDVLLRQTHRSGMILNSSGGLKPGSEGPAHLRDRGLGYWEVYPSA